MVLSSPRTLGAPIRRPGGRLVAVWLAATVLFVATGDAEAQWRARMSKDLERVMQGVDSEATSVIITAPQSKVDALAARHGLTVQRRLAKGAVLRVPAYRLGAVAADADVDYLSSNHVVTSQMSVSNQATGADQVQAGFAALGLRGLTGKGIGVAVIDSGVANAQELKGRVVASIDFTDGHGQGLDQHGHGTHVAGIIAAAGANQHDDTRGVAPGAHIINLKVLDAQGRGKAADVIAAIDWAVENRVKYGIRIINLSLGGPVLQSSRDDTL